MDTRESLILAHLDLARSIAVKFGRANGHDHATIEDHIGEASMALVRAVDAHDSSRGPIEPYVQTAVQNAVAREYFRTLPPEDISIESLDRLIEAGADFGEGCGLASVVGDDVAKYILGRVAVVGPARDRCILALRLGLIGPPSTFPEIAEAIGITPDAARMAFNRAVSSLAKISCEAA